MKRTTKQDSGGVDTTAEKMMDASHPEKKVGVAHANQPRVCGAIKQLVSEVTALFPEMTDAITYSNYDGRNTALDVSFDMTALAGDGESLYLLATLLRSVNTDSRVDSVVVEDRQALVSMRSSLRTQDLRTTFNVAEAYDVLTEEDGSW